MEAHNRAIQLDSLFWTEPSTYNHLVLTGPVEVKSALVPSLLVGRYQDAVKVLRDAKQFFSRLPDLPIISTIDPFGVPTLLHSDPPLHQHLRTAAAAYFKPGVWEFLGCRLSHDLNSLLDRIQTRGEFDGVADLARPLAFALVSEILGLRPEAQSRLQYLTEAIFAGIRSSAIAATRFLGNEGVCSPTSLFPKSNADAIAEVREYFARELQLRKAYRGEDLISALLTHSEHATERPWRPEDIIGMALLVLFAGNDTAAAMISNLLLALTEHPNQMRGVASEVDSIASATEEILRFYSPVQMVLRFCLNEALLGETRIRPGSVIIVMLTSANRDPAQFRSPDRFDARRNPNHHLAFGDGIHKCLGAPIARLLSRIVLEAIVKRFRYVQLRSSETPPTYDDSILSRRLSSLPLTIG